MVYFLNIKCQYLNVFGWGWLIFTILLTVPATELFAQNDSIRQIKQSLAKARKSQKIDLLNILCDLYKKFRPDSALVYGDSALNLSLQEGIQSRLGRGQCPYRNYPVSGREFRTGPAVF